MNTIKFSEPGWVKLYHPRMEKFIRYEVEKRQFVTIIISDKPPDQKKPESHEEKQKQNEHGQKDVEEKKSGVRGMTLLIVLLAILVLALFFSGLNKSEPVQDVPKLRPNHYELPQSY